MQRVKRCTVTFLPGKASVPVPQGETVLAAAEKAGIALNAVCGGSGTCGKCRVLVKRGTMRIDGETHRISPRTGRGMECLACRTTVEGDCDVHVPPSSLFDAWETGDVSSLPWRWAGDRGKERDLRPLVESISIESGGRGGIRSEPEWESAVKAFRERGGALSAASGKVIAAGSEVESSAGREGGIVIDSSLTAFRKVLDTIGRGEGRTRLYICRDDGRREIIHAERRRVKGEREFLGAALDLGTTTLVLRILDLASGETISERSEYNGQIACGADIMHRIMYARKRSNLRKLRDLVLATVRSLLESSLRELGLSPRRVFALVVAGNATMEHLLLGVDPGPIRSPPHIPGFLDSPGFPARDLKIPIFPRAPVRLMQGVAGYLGADIVSGALSVGLHRERRLTLYIDLGTNGEILLGNREWLTGCACSAGPAFEGAGVKCGMRAAPGAIDKVVITDREGDLRTRVIGGGLPRGICGSGMIDLLWDLFRIGIIDRRGRFASGSACGRIRGEGRFREYLLCSGEHTAHGEDIVITETDLENLIRTKGALWAGIRTLLKLLDLDIESIEQVIVAGRLGRHCNLEKSIAIGLLPDLPLDRFRYVGDAALDGASLYLLSEEARAETGEIAGMITYVDLSTECSYMDEFIASLFIPHTDLTLFPSSARSMTI